MSYAIYRATRRTFAQNMPARDDYDAAPTARATKQHRYFATLPPARHRYVPKARVGHTGLLSILRYKYHLIMKLD